MKPRNPAKRFISMLLALAMILGLLPTSIVWAEEATPGVQPASAFFTDLKIGDVWVIQNGVLLVDEDDDNEYFYNDCYGQRYGSIRSKATEPNSRLPVWTVEENTVTINGSLGSSSQPFTVGIYARHPEGRSLNVRAMTHPAFIYAQTAIWNDSDAPVTNIIPYPKAWEKTGTQNELWIENAVYGIVNGNMETPRSGEHMVNIQSSVRITLSSASANPVAIYCRGAQKGTVGTGIRAPGEVRVTPDMAGRWGTVADSTAELNDGLLIYGPDSSSGAGALGIDTGYWIAAGESTPHYEPGYGFSLYRSHEEGGHSSNVWYQYANFGRALTENTHACLSLTSDRPSDALYESGNYTSGKYTVTELRQATDVRVAGSVEDLKKYLADARVTQIMFQPTVPANAQYLVGDDSIDLNGYIFTVAGKKSLYFAQTLNLTEGSGGDHKLTNNYNGIFYIGPSAELTVATADAETCGVTVMLGKRTKTDGVSPAANYLFRVEQGGKLNIESGVYECNVFANTASGENYGGSEQEGYYPFALPKLYNLQLYNWMSGTDGVYGAAVMVERAGTLNIYGGTLGGGVNGASSVALGVVNAAEGAHVNMYGGTIDAHYTAFAPKDARTFSYPTANQLLFFGKGISALAGYDVNAGFQRANIVSGNFRVLGNTATLYYEFDAASLKHVRKENKNLKITTALESTAGLTMADFAATALAPLEANHFADSWVTYPKLAASSQDNKYSAFELNYRVVPLLKVDNGVRMSWNNTDETDPYYEVSVNGGTPPEFVVNAAVTFFGGLTSAENGGTSGHQYDTIAWQWSIDNESNDDYWFDVESGDGLVTYCSDRQLIPAYRIGRDDWFRFRASDSTGHLPPVTSKILIHYAETDVTAPLTSAYASGMSYATPDAPATITLGSWEGLVTSEAPATGSKAVTRLEVVSAPAGAAVGTRIFSGESKTSFSFPADMRKSSLRPYVPGTYTLRVSQVVATATTQRTVYSQPVTLELKVPPTGFALHYDADWYYDSDGGGAPALHTSGIGPVNLSASLVPETASLELSSEITFTSSDMSVCIPTADGSGIVAVGPGRATITASMVGMADQSVDVVVPVNDLAITGLDLPVFGESFDNEVTFAGALALEGCVESCTVVWKNNSSYVVEATPAVGSRYRCTIDLYLAEGYELPTYQYTAGYILPDRAALRVRVNGETPAPDSNTTGFTFWMDPDDARHVTIYYLSDRVYNPGAETISTLYATTTPRWSMGRS